jgi:hypothetical protein
MMSPSLRISADDQLNDAKMLHNIIVQAHVTDKHESKNGRLLIGFSTNIISYTVLGWLKVVMKSVTWQGVGGTEMCYKL